MNHYSTEPIEVDDVEEFRENTSPKYCKQCGAELLVLRSAPPNNRLINPYTGKPYDDDYEYRCPSNKKHSKWLMYFEQWGPDNMTLHMVEV